MLSAKCLPFCSMTILVYYCIQILQDQIKYGYNIDDL